MIRFKCPCCQVALQARDDSLGRKVCCPKCRQILNIPSPVNMPAPTSAPNRLGEVEKLEGKPSPVAAASSPPVLEPADIPDHKGMQEDRSAATPIAVELHLSPSQKGWAIILGTAALIIGLWPLSPRLGVLATASLIIGLFMRKKGAPVDRALIMASLGTAALSIGLLYLCSTLVRNLEDLRLDMYEWGFPSDVIERLHAKDRQAHQETMAFGSFFVPAGVVLLVLSSRFRTSSILGITSLAFGVIVFLRFCNVKTAFRIGGTLYRDHAREHDQVVGILVGIGWIIASLLFLLLVRLPNVLSYMQSQALIKSPDNSRAG